MDTTSTVPATAAAAAPAATAQVEKINAIISPGNVTVHHPQPITNGVIIVPGGVVNGHAPIAAQPGFMGISPAVAVTPSVAPRIEPITPVISVVETGAVPRPMPVDLQAQIAGVARPMPTHLQPNVQIAHHMPGGFLPAENIAQHQPGHLQQPGVQHQPGFLPGQIAQQQPGHLEQHPAQHQPGFLPGHVAQPQPGHLQPISNLPGFVPGQIAQQQPGHLEQHPPQHLPGVLPGHVAQPTPGHYQPISNLPGFVPGQIAQQQPGHLEQHPPQHLPGFLPGQVAQPQPGHFQPISNLPGFLPAEVANQQPGHLHPGGGFLPSDAQVARPFPVEHHQDAGVARPIPEHLQAGVARPFPVEHHQDAGVARPIPDHLQAGVARPFPVEHHQDAGVARPIPEHLQAGVVRPFPVEHHQDAGVARPIPEHLQAGVARPFPVEHHQDAGVARPIPEHLQAGVARPFPVEHHQDAGVARPIPDHLQIPSTNEQPAGVARPMPTHLQNLDQQQQPAGIARPIPDILQTPPPMHTAVPAVVAPSVNPRHIQLNQFIGNALNEVIITEGFTSYSIQLDNGSNHGDGFVGEIVKATIHGERTQNGQIIEDSELVLIIKVPPVNEMRRQMMGNKLFEREITMYNEVLPALVRFQNEHGLREGGVGFFDFPKCYRAHFDAVVMDNTFIIMEDIRERGFKLESKYQPIKLANARLVMEKLGQLHGISFAMKNQRPEEFARFTNLQDVMLVGNTSEKEMLTNMILKSVERAVGCLGDHEQRLKEKIRQAAANFHGESDRYLGQNSEPFSVINHGDCWLNNMMFKFESGRPLNICFLDWQCSRYSSPILDVVYFLYLCSDSALRDRFYDDLLQAYHHSLRAQLERFNEDVNDLFPFTTMLRHMRQYGRFALSMALMIIPMLCTNNADIPDLNQLTDNIAAGAMDDAMQQFASSENDRNNYNIRMGGILRDMNKRGFF